MAGKTKGEKSKGLDEELSRLKKIAIIFTQVWREPVLRPRQLGAQATMGTPFQAHPCLGLPDFGPIEYRCSGSRKPMFSHVQALEHLTRHHYEFFKGVNLTEDLGRPERKSEHLRPPKKQKKQRPQKRPRYDD